jgi:hypothetical protein
MKKRLTKGDRVMALQSRSDDWDESMMDQATDLANDLYNEECLSLRHVFQHGGVCAVDGAHRMNIISVIIAARAVDSGEPVDVRYQPSLPGVEWAEDDVRDIIEDPVNRELLALAEEIRSMEKK